MIPSNADRSMSKAPMVAQKVQILSKQLGLMGCSAAISFTFSRRKHVYLLIKLNFNGEYTQRPSYYYVEKILEECLSKRILRRILHITDNYT
jgi:hypothetical protein